MNRPKFETVTSPKGTYWRLVAGNGEILCHSEMYSTINAADKGIRSTRFNAPVARTERVNELTKATHDRR